jgi:hypothetical protein
MSENNNNSEWLRQQYKTQPQINGNIIKKPYKHSITDTSLNKHTINERTPNNYKCCDNQIIAMSNDGNKTILCRNCNYIYRSPTMSSTFPLFYNFED